MEEQKTEGGGRLINQLNPLEEKSGGIKEQIEGENRFGWLARTLVIIFIVILIIGSFVASFLVGRRIFTFVRELPSQSKATITLPENPPEVKEPAPVAPAAENPAPPAPVVKTPAAPVATAPTAATAKPAPVKLKVAVPKVKAAPAPIAEEGTGSIYKVQIGNYKSRAAAVSVAKKLSAAGIDGFVREMGPDKFRVQVGAFSSKKSAQNLANTLRSKGFSPLLYAE